MGVSELKNLHLEKMQNAKETKTGKKIEEDEKAGRRSKEAESGSRIRYEADPAFR